MAEFNQRQSQAAPPSFSGMSQGIRADRDNSLGMLFEGLAQSLEMGVREQDRNIKENIQQDIFDEVDSVQAEFGVPEATDLQADADEASLRTAPLGVQRAGAQLQTLQTAYARGALKESHYWARMNSVVRQLRGKYPGYRAEIDTMVAGVTGSRPANALRSALMREWDAAASSENSLADLEEWAVKQGHLPVDYYERQATDNPYTETELKAHVAGRTRNEAEVASRRASLGLAIDQDKVNTNDVERNFRVEANQFVTTLLQDSATASGGAYRELQARIKEAQKASAAGKPLEQLEVNELRGMMGELKQNVRQALHQQFLESWDGDPQHSYAAHLSNDQREAIIETAMAPIAVLEEAITSDNPWGVLGAQAAWLEAQKSDDARELLRDMPMSREMQALSTTLGSDVLGQYLTLSPALQDEIDASLINYRSLRAARANSNGETISTAFQDGQAKDRGPEYYNSLTERWTNLVDTMAAGELPTELLQNNTTYMFGPGSERVLSMLDDVSRFEYFRKVSSPAVTKQLMALRDQGDQQTWETYQRWVATSFQSLFMQKMQDIQGLVRNPGVIVSWDDVNKRFKATVPAAAENQIPDNSFIAANAPQLAGQMNSVSTDLQTRKFQSMLDQLNTTIGVIRPIIEDAGGETDKEILGMLMQMGYDPDQQGQDAGILGMMIETIRERFGNGQES